MHNPIRILIVEDLPTDAELAQREILKTLDACVFQRVDTRRDYLTALETFQPDLIVSDYHMPRFDGMAALKLALERAPLTPLIILTGSQNEDTAVDSMKAGASNYVIKEQIKRLGPALVHALEEKQVRLERKRAEDALKESEARFSTVFRVSPIGISITRLVDGQFVDVNDAFLRMFGYTREETIGHTSLELQMFGDPGDRDLLVKMLHERGRIHDIETQFHKKSGDCGTLLVSAALLALAGERYLVSTLHDITERKRADDALRQSEMRYRSLFENMREGFAYCQMIFENDQPRDFRYLAVNDMFETLTGLKDVVGKRVTEVIPGIREADPELFEIYARVSLTGKPEKFEMFVAALKMWFSVSVYSPQTEFFVAVFDVITERKRAEEKLRESEARFRTLFETMSQGVVHQDAEGKIIAANPAAERILGVTLDQMQGRTSFDPRWRAIREDGTDLPGETDPAMVALSTGRVVRDTVMGVFNPKEGRHMWININAVPQFKPGAVHPYQVYTTFEDFSERKRAQDILQARLRLIEFGGSHSVKELLQATLDEAGALTTSPIGFYHFLAQDQETIMLQAWSTRTRKEFCQAEENRHYPVAEAGVWADCVRERGPVIHNDYATLEQRRGLPPGHAPITRELVVPVLRANRIVAIVGVGNKPDSYTPVDLEILSSLADFSWDIVERKRVEIEIQRSSEQLAVLNDAALTIQQHLDPDQIYRMACEELRRFGTFASVYRINADGWLRHVHTAMSGELLTDYVARFGDRPINPALPISTVPGATEGLRAGAQVLNAQAIHRVLQKASLEGHPVIEWMFARPHQELMLLAPLTQGDKTVGLLSVLGESLGEVDVPAVTLFARQVSVALENAQLFGAEQARRAELAGLYDLARALAGTDSFDETLHLIVQHAVETIRVTFARLALLDHDQFVIRAAYPIRTLNCDLNAEREEPANQLEFCQRVLAQSAPVVVYADDPALSPHDRHMLFLGIAKSACLAPLRAGDVPIGILILAEARAPEREPFNAEKCNLARAIGDQAAGAIRRVTLHAQTQRDAQDLADAYDATIEGWSRALDLRDNETEGHTQRVTELTVRLARAFGFDAEQLVRVRRGALLHDIGKMGIPDAILLKPGTLTEQEWEIMRRHPDYAQMLLTPIYYLAPALDIPYCHHEKWNGTGYPRGLKGDQIPLAARLFAVVDVWDALTSNRPYRAAWPKVRAREYICAQSGSHFEPHAVEQFLKLLDTEKSSRALAEWQG
ncbi:MAG: GAF domain-containing protein [Chloroflexi bacterium]|nr:GAF domain-containing protein [Chloroflexota bacterium]